MPWQDLAFTAGSIVLAGTLWPTIRDPTASVPRLTSIPTAAVLYAFAFVYSTLDFWLSASVSLATALAWTAIAVWRN